MAAETMGLLETESLLNLRRRTVNSRRPERARNEGSTGPKRLDAGPTSLHTPLEARNGTILNPNFVVNFHVTSPLQQVGHEIFLVSNGRARCRKNHCSG